MPLAIGILGFIGSLACVAWVYQNYARLVIGYELGAERFSITLFGSIQVFSVKYADITHVEEVPFTKALNFGVQMFSFGNKLFGSIVIITKRSGVFRKVAVTPDDAELFVLCCKKHLNQI